MMTLEMYMMHQTEQRPTRAQDPLRKAPNAPILFPLKSHFWTLLFMKRTLR